jgi:hypothetical protein
MLTAAARRLGDGQALTQSVEVEGQLASPFETLRLPRG